MPRQVRWVCQVHAAPPAPLPALHFKTVGHLLLGSNGHPLPNPLGFCSTGGKVEPGSGMQMEVSPGGLQGF